MNHNAMKTLGRDRLQNIVNQLGQVFSAKEVATVLKIDNSRASMLLSKWCSQKWVARVKRGLFVFVPLEATNGESALEEPMVLLPHLFKQYYVGGWSALEHWGLTDQIFNKILVLTSDPVLNKEKKLLGVTYVSKHVLERFCFGLEPIWVGREKIMFSNPHKTIVDVLATPWIGGGIVQVKECLMEYLSGEHYDLGSFVGTIKQQNNGAVFKRLGFLLSQSNLDFQELIQICSKNLTKGKVKLDPHMKCSKLATKWNLWVAGDALSA